MTTRVISWPRGIFLFFVIIALFQAYLVKVSLSAPSTVIDDRPYERGIAYQEVIDQKNAASDKGLALSYSFVPTIGKSKLKIMLNGQLAGHKVLELRILKSNDAKHDQTLTVVSDGQTFEIDMPKLDPGLYFFKSTLRAGEASYFFESRETVN